MLLTLTDYNNVEHNSLRRRQRDICGLSSYGTLCSSTNMRVGPLYTIATPLFSDILPYVRGTFFFGQVQNLRLDVRYPCCTDLLYEFWCEGGGVGTEF